MYKSTKVRRTTLISTLVWSRLWQGKHHTEVLSVIETNKIVKRELENVTRNISNSVFDMVQFSVIVITIGVKDLVFFSTRNDMSLEEWWFAKSAEILSPLFVQRIDKFSFYFSTFVFSASPPLFFFHVICPTLWFRIFLILNCSTMLIDFIVYFSSIIRVQILLEF